MKIDVSEKYLPIYEALSSNVRIKIIEILSVKALNIKEIANEMKLSSAIITMHINKLEKAGIVKAERVKIKGGTQKICYLVMDSLQIEFPKTNKDTIKAHEYALSVGHYTDFQVTPTCGLSTTDKIIGYFDDPRYFWDAERVNASILWFTRGFIEYKLPNYLLESQQPIELEISLEICSEAPGYNEDWPSDITFFINGINIGYWTSPGDFAKEKGKYTPDWWNRDINQYGMLKVIKINKEGTFIDGRKMSDIKLDDINILSKQWSFKISVQEDAQHIGGVTILGKGFGNYNQDILFKLYYEEKTGL